MKKKNRPLFPNGYNVVKKEKPVRKKVKRSAGQERVIKQLESSIRKLQYRLNKNKGLEYQGTFEEDGKVYNYTIDMEEIYTRDWKEQLDLLKKYRSDLKKSKIVFTRKQEKIYKELFSYVNTGSTLYEGVVVSSKEARTNKLILDSLSRKGIDITNPQEVYDTLGGMTPQDLYDWWEKNSNLTYYEAMYEKFEDFLQEIGIEAVKESLKQEADDQLAIASGLRENF